MKKIFRVLGAVLSLFAVFMWASCTTDVGGGENQGQTVVNPDDGGSGDNSGESGQSGEQGGDSGQTGGETGGESGGDEVKEYTVELDFSTNTWNFPTSIGADTTFTKDGITFAFEKGGNSGAAAFYTKEIRAYANNTITITPAVDSTITKIVFNESGGGKTIPLSVNTGAITETVGTADNEVTWTGATSSAIVITLGASGQFRFNKITITYKGGTAPSTSDEGSENGGESGETGGHTGGETVSTGDEVIEFPSNAAVTSGDGHTSDIAENSALYLGNPSGAVKDVTQENNYLMEKTTFALSYNNTTHNPNWVSWHLCADDMGTLDRTSFSADTTLPDGWYRVTDNDYKTATFNGNGMTRGHMCPNMDRNKDSVLQKEVFLMTNMVPQTANNNNAVWASLETQEVAWAKAGKELYIICGPHGIGGTYHPTSVNFIGTVYGNSTRINYIKITNPNNENDPGIVVPATTWRVVLVMEEGTGDLERITTDNTTAIAINLPNTYECKYTSTGALKTWTDYLCSIDDIEAMTGYDFFANLPDEVETVLEAKVYEQ